MNKHIKTILGAATLLFITSLAQADYIVTYPMEQSNGGSLSNSSIVIKEHPNTVVTPPVSKDPICQRDSGTLWLSGRDIYNTYSVYWDGVLISTGAGYDLTTITVDGYKYTKDAVTDNFGYYTYSSLCRVAI